MASSDVTKDSKADVYGQYHPVETSDMISAKLEEFEREIKKLPEDTKASLLEAEEKCPDLVTDKFKLIFLRSEVFNADVSILRVCNALSVSQMTRRHLTRAIFRSSRVWRRFLKKNKARCHALRQVLG